jgi:hypothetical protein
MRRRGNKSNKVCHLAYYYLRSLIFYRFLVSGFAPLKKALFLDPWRRVAGHKTLKQGATTPLSWIYVQGLLKVL